MKEVNEKISTICDYITLIKEKMKNLKGDKELTNIWFRGEPFSNKNFTPLIPKAYRLYNAYIDDVYAQTKTIEPSMKAEFKRQALPYILSKGIPVNDWNNYFIMVHHGLRTRLLDWTESALIALFFAIESLSEEDAKIWLLNAHKLNKYSTSKLHPQNPGSSCIPIPSESEKKPLFDDSGKINMEELTRIYLNMDFELNTIDRKISYYPLAIMPTFLDERMSIQLSCFTIFGNIVNGLLEIEQNNSFLDFVIIDFNAKRNLKEELQWLGINHRSIYPNLTGISKSIEFKYNSDLFLKRTK